MNHAVLVMMLFCHVIRFHLYLMLISLLIMWKGLLIIFKGLLARMDLLLCSGIVIFCDLVHTVHVYVMLWLDWLVV